MVRRLDLDVRILSRVSVPCDFPNRALSLKLKVIRLTLRAVRKRGGAGDYEAWPAGGVKTKE